MLGGSLDGMFAVPSMGRMERMGKVQRSICQGREEWSRGEQGLAQPSWVVRSSGQTGLSSQAAQCCLQGHPQETPFPTQSSPGPPIWEWGGTRATYGRTGTPMPV